MKGFITSIDITPDIVDGYEGKVKLQSGGVIIEMQVEDTKTVQEFVDAMFSRTAVKVVIKGDSHE